MEVQQTKTLVINIATGTVIVGVIAAAYMVFFKKDSTPVASVTTSIQTAEQTIVIGAQVSGTLRELEDLKRAVGASVEVFRSRAFQDLQNLSASVPEESVGRSNPFEPTTWKLRQKAFEEAATKRGSGTTQAASGI